VRHRTAPTPDRRWTILGVLFLARTAMGFQFQSVASTAPFLIHDLQIGFASIGTLIGLYMLPGVFIAFPGGLLGQRFGDKTICAAGLALMLAGGVLMGVGPLVAVVFAGRIVSGTGAVLFNLVLTKMVTDWFAGREIVLAMAVILATWPLGIGAALVSQPLLAASYGWPWVMLLAAALCGVALLLIVGCYRDPARAAPTAVPLLPPLREMLPTAVAGVIWGSLNLALVLFFSFVPGLLAGFGMPFATAAAWTGTGLWVVMLSLPAFGILVQRTGRPDTAIVAGAALGAAILVLLTAGVVPLALCAVFGLAVGLPAGPIMALPARVLGPPHRAGGLGLFYTIYYAFMAFGPAAAGLLRETFATPAAPVLLGAALFAAMIPLLRLFEALAGRGHPHPGPLPHAGEGEETA
jgi:MFS family permease